MKKILDLEVFAKRFFGFLAFFGWSVGLLLGNAVFSETVQSVFLVFCMRLEGYKGRKVTKQGF